MKLLPKDEWLITKCGPEHICAGIWEHPKFPNTMYKKKIPLADLPDNLISQDDLIRFGIDLVDV